MKERKDATCLVTGTHWGEFNFLLRNCQIHHAPELKCGNKLSAQIYECWKRFISLCLSDKVKYFVIILVKKTSWKTNIEERKQISLYCCWMATWIYVPSPCCFDVHISRVVSITIILKTTVRGLHRPCGGDLEQTVDSFMAHISNLKRSSVEDRFSDSCFWDIVSVDYAVRRYHLLFDYNINGLTIVFPSWRRLAPPA